MMESLEPATFLYLGPAIGQPEFRAPVAIIVDKGLVLRVGYQPVGHSEGFKVYLVTWQFVVEAEFIAGIAGFYQASGVFVPGHLGNWPRNW